jgi:single-strand DNA-binding protein
MNDTQITVQGFVGGVVSLKRAGDTEVATFRLGSTPRYYNRRSEQWVDAPTQWYTVNAWRGMARNVASSLIKGDGVTVVGRLNVSTWTAQDGSERLTLEIEATSVGHDLRHGTTRLARNEKPQREQAASDVETAPGQQVGLSAPVTEEAVAVEAPQPDPVGDWRADPSAA